MQLNLGIPDLKVYLACGQNNWKGGEGYLFKDMGGGAYEISDNIIRSARLFKLYILTKKAGSIVDDIKDRIVGNGHELSDIEEVGEGYVRCWFLSTRYKFAIDSYGVKNNECADEQERSDAIQKLVDRYAGYIAAFICLGVIAHLVLSNKPMASPFLENMVLFMASLSASIFAARIPGYFHIRSKLKGIAFRAGGALGIFILVFKFAPTTEPYRNLAAPALGGSIEIGKDFHFDIRPKVDYNQSIDKIKNSSVMVSVGSSVKNVLTKKNITIDEINLELDLCKSSTLKWQYNVNQHGENNGKWLGIENSVSPFTIEPDKVRSFEVMFTPMSFSWDEALRCIVKKPRIEAKMTYHSAGGSIDAYYEVNLEEYVSAIEKEVSSGTVPFSITHRQ
ncbi:MAG: hypothetical protein HQL51_08480 [Magnetococcales bacterium]|nr:hypothetical protein [Magnetococcales bacterium]